MTGKWILHMVMLGICSAEDYREKRISSWKLLFVCRARIFVWNLGIQRTGERTWKMDTE